MRLKRIRLENICQFCHFDHTFHPGLTGILGPNGSGKSNLTKSVEFALTGTFRNVGVKADNVAQLGEGKRSAVTLELEHGGVSMEVVRGLAGVKTRLRVGGEEILGDVAVTAKILEILAVDARLLGEYVFVLQLHMTDFIDATPGDRARAFQRLFGTDECEAVNAFISKVLDQELRLAAPADLAAIEVRLATNGARMDGLIDRLEHLDREIMVVDALAMAGQQLIADAERAEAMTREMEELVARLTTLAADYEACLRDRDETKVELDDLEAALAAAADDADAARVALITWQEVERRRIRAGMLARRRETLERECAAHARPDVSPPPTDEELAELKRLHARHDLLESRRELAASGLGECPTCGQPVAGVWDAAGLDAELRHVAAALEVIEDKVNAHHRRRAAREAWEAWHERYVAALVDLVAQESDLAAEGVNGPAVDPESLQVAVDHEAGLKALIRALRDRYSRASTDFARLAGRRDQMEARRREIETTVSQLVVPPEVVHKARADLARRQTLRLERGRVEGEIAELERSLDEDDRTLRRLRDVEDKNARMRVLLEGARQVLAVTHRNAAPRLVSEAHLDRLVGDIDGYLELFGSDFRVRLGEGLSFVADFVDGRMQAGGRLSEGQKGVLALAFWVSVNSVFASGMDFLSLDEPTSSLDQQNLGVLGVALGQLREISETTGLQCLLVTHEPSLVGLFDEIIQL